MIQSVTDDGYPILIPESFHGYKIKKVLGTGSTSVVFLVENQNTGKLFSAKIISKKYIEKMNLEQKVQNEILVMKKIHHSNIVKLYETLELEPNKGDKYIVMILEYCEKGDLFSFTIENEFENDQQKYKIFRGLLKAIKYLHSNNIAHGDIKPENILLDSEFNAKLADFGYCKTSIIAGDESKNGTLQYAPPELFYKGEFDSLKSDIWSIGITLYSISQKRFPFRNGNDKYILNQILSGNLYLNESTPEDLKKMVKRCTQMDPENRPSIDELIDDDYFSKSDDYKNDYPKVNEYTNDTDSFQIRSWSN